MSLKNHLQDIIARRKRGETMAEIAAVYNVSRQRVQQIAPGIGRRSTQSESRPHHHPALIAEARVLWHEGLPAETIAEALSTKERAVTRDAIIGMAHRHEFGPHPAGAPRLWTKTELTALWKRRQNGEQFKTIARDLNRTFSATHARYRKLREEHGFDLS